MNIDWSSFFGDGRNEDSTYLKFDTFSLKLSPDFPEERNYSLIVSESGRCTAYFSMLMYQWPDEDDYDEVFAFVHVEDCESGECRKVVDFFEDDISKASSETPDIIPVMQDFREFLLKNGFECGGCIPASGTQEYHNPLAIKFEYEETNKTNKDSMSDVKHLKYISFKARCAYRNKVCDGKEFANVKNLWSYVKIQYLFDHNNPDEIKAWVNSDHPSDGYYSNKELNEIRDILNEL